MAFDKRKSLQNALNYTQQGKWDRAIAEYLLILKTDPKDLTVCNNLGDLYARGGRVAEAIEQYQKLGELYRADGLSVKAIAVYKKIAKLDPSLTSAYQACADLYWEQGLVGEAKIQMATVAEHYLRAGDRPKLIETYRRLTQFDPTNTAAIARLADLLLKEGKQEDAAAEYDRAAQTAQAAGQTAEADRFFQKARELLPRTPEENLDLAETLRADGRLAEAEELLRKITAAKPEDAKAWQALGEVQGSLGKSAEAVVTLQQATLLGLPESAVAPVLGQALLQAGRFDEAVELCRRLCDTALALGDPNQAIACCRGLLAVSPHLIPLHAHLASMLQSLGRNDEAVPAIRALAAAQEAAGETDAAIESYRRLVDLDPTDVDAQAALEALSPAEPPTLEVVDLTPASTPEEAVPSVDEPPLLLEEIGAGSQDGAQDLGLSGLEDLSLSFGKDEVALLLEEPSEATQETLQGPNLSMDKEGFGLELGSEIETEAGAGTVIEAETEIVLAPETQPEPETEKTIEPVSTPDWLSQGFEPLELEAQPPDTGVVPVEWPSQEAPIGLSDAPSGIGAPTQGEPPSLDLTPQTDEPAPSEFGAPLASEGFPEETIESAPESAELLRGAGVEAVARQPLPSEQEKDSADQVAEQLAEAEVYQKYGLEEKARERFLEVLRLAPENLTAHRGLKAIYLERGQIVDVCAEILAIAQVLRERGIEAAAVEEIQAGLALAPENPELRRFFADAREVREQAAGAETAEVPRHPEPRVAIEPAWSSAEKSAEEPPRESLIPPEPVAAAVNDAPPPDVPLLLEFEETPPASPGPGVDLNHVVGTPQAEELPSELRALLDEMDDRPTVEFETVEPSVDQTMEDDVAEADFYLSQGMTDEARTVLRRMQERNPDHLSVAALAGRITQVVETPFPAPVAEASVPVQAGQPLPAEEPAVAPISTEDIEPSRQEILPQFAVTDAQAESSEAAGVAEGAEQQEGVASDDRLAMPMEDGPLVDGLLKEFKKGDPEPLVEKDYETHYNLGIAYKEMELFDEAIQEFRLTLREPSRALDSADLIGLCYLAKGQPDQAIQDLQAGLGLQGSSPEAYHSLRHDLGTAYEAVGDLGRALEQFEILHSEGARFPDVQARIQTLRGRLSQAPEPKKVDEKPPRKKKKISFI